MSTTSPIKRHSGRSVLLVSLCIIVCYISVLALLSIRLQHAKSEVSDWVFVYSGRDPDDVRAAAKVRDILGIRTLSLTTQEGKQLLQRLSKTVVVATPMLVIGSTPDEQVVTGSLEVNKRLDIERDRRLNLAQGKRFALLVILAAMLAAAFISTLAIALPTYPLIGILANGLAIPKCLNCLAFDGPSFQGLINIGSLLAFLLIGVLVWLRLLQKNAIRMLVVVLASLLIVGNGVLLLVKPKMCLPCYVMTAAALCVLLSVLHFSQHVRAQVLSVNRLWVAGTIAVSLLFVSQHIAASRAPASVAVRRSLIGQSLASIGLNGISGDPDQIILLSDPKCEPCVQAKTYLTTRGIAFVEVLACTFSRPAGCYNIVNSVTPTFLRVNKEGKVVWAQEGWFLSDEASRAEIDSYLREKN